MEIRYSEKFKSFLKKVDKTPEIRLRLDLFGVGNYIDTGGDYHKNRALYTGIISYQIFAVGIQNVKKIYKWYQSHPKEVMKFMKQKK